MYLLPALVLLVGAPEYDIVVYGATPGGITAAVQAARMHRTVVLIEPSMHLGGMTAGGLGATDIGNKKAIGGLAREFYQRVKKHYDQDTSWIYEKRSKFQGTGHDPRDDAAWTFEPHVAAKIFDDLLREHKILVLLGERLDLRKFVQKEGKRIVALRLDSGKIIRGRMFIDATYEGDLMAQAPVPYHIGRESNRTYGEALNGVQVKNATHHQFVKNVDPYWKPGDPTSGLIPGVHAGSPYTPSTASSIISGPGQAAADGAGDQRIQAYNFRLCATDRAANRRPWPRPAGYDEKQYELLLRNFEAGDLRLPWNIVYLPNRKTDANNNFAFSTDNLGANNRYPEGDYDTRARIWQAHLQYTQGLMWTLANHPRVPEKVRQHFQRWGLARDEFVDNDNWPRQLYIREARRMLGVYVMTEANCRGTRREKDSVGLAAYTMDSHNVQRYVTREGFVRNEGDVQVGGFPPYPISYRSLVPEEGYCTNLLVPVCLSASHISYGSIRMEPVFMVLGQSAATAAAISLEDKIDVQRVDYQKLRRRLLHDKQVLDWPVGK
jgi:hypothetical protein